MKIKLILWKLQSFSELSSSDSGQRVDLRLPGLPVWWPAAPGPTECGWVTSDGGAGTPSGAEELGWGSSCSWQRCCVTAVSLAALQTAGGFPIQSKFPFQPETKFQLPQILLFLEITFSNQVSIPSFFSFFKEVPKAVGFVSAVVSKENCPHRWCPHQSDPAALRWAASGFLSR